MLKIYHNPRCNKSRQGLQILEESKVDFEIIKYLDTPPNFQELSAIIKSLGITPLALVRKGEAIWKEQFKGKELTDDQIIQAMCDFPKLIERPIVIKDQKAVLGRPPESIKSLL